MSGPQPVNRHPKPGQPSKQDLIIQALQNVVNATRSQFVFSLLTEMGLPFWRRLEQLQRLGFLTDGDLLNVVGPEALMAQEDDPYWGPLATKLKVAKAEAEAKKEQAPPAVN